MRSRQRVGRSALLLVAGLLAAHAFGHRARSCLTTVTWNATTGNTEIVHRLHTHDAELGIGEITGRTDLSVLDLEGRALMALYVEERFAIADADGPLPLDLVGAEVTGDYLLVYQERPGRLSGTIRVRSDILKDVYPQQLNLVNIADGDTVRTLSFDAETHWVAYEFGRAGP